MSEVRPSIKVASISQIKPNKHISDSKPEEMQSRGDLQQLCVEPYPYPVGIDCILSFDVSERYTWGKCSQLNAKTGSEALLISWAGLWGNNYRNSSVVQRYCLKKFK